jgi:hypothetical protein
MRLPSYISDLLYRYDCVIVPDFGAFLTKRLSAHVDTDRHLLYPPRKVLSFNPQLKHNDGLLCNHIAEIEKLPYGQALEILQKEVRSLLEVLKAKQSLDLPGIGNLTLGSEGAIHFEPNKEINYLTSSFGLSNFEASSIDRVVHKKVVETIETSTAITLSQESRKSNRWLGYAAAAVVVLGLGSLGAFKYYENQVKEHNELVQQEAQKKVDSKVQEATFVISNPLPMASFEIEKQTGNYHIVAGAFRIESNSDKKVKQLKKLGYKARKIGVNRYGLHEVVYSSYQTRSEAQQALRAIRANHNPDAWLLIKSLD